MGAILETAELAERLVADELGQTFSLDKSRLYSLINGEQGYTLTLASEHGDVYDLLNESDSKDVARVSDFIVVVTCGWASPLSGDDDDDEVAPSQHPQRRRVRLVVCASRDGMASVLRFQDTPDDTITDEGEARGSLAEAVQSLFF
jgi:hypothetical protein